MSLKSTLTLLFTLSLSSAATWASQLKLWYDAPASEWVEALPLGNSRLGMMVYGSPAHEEIQLNEETLWGGSPHTNHSARALKALPEVRRLVFAGRNAEAQALIDTTFLTGVNGMPYQTVGSLRLNFPGHENATAYYRDLDLDSALTTVTVLSATKPSSARCCRTSSLPVTFRMTTVSPGFAIVSGMLFPPISTVSFLLTSGVFLRLAFTNLFFVP